MSDADGAGPVQAAIQLAVSAPVAPPVADLPPAVQSLALSLGVGSLITLACMRLRVPPILWLLLAGLALGRSGLGRWDAALIDGDALGPGLLGFIAVSISLLIFEGSLHLERRELAQSPRAVRGLLTIGVLTTWAAGAVLARALLGLSWSASILLGAMLIVTGPTVIQPILRRVPLRPNLHAALMAEGILIDPIGAVAAAATLEVTLAALAGQAGGPMRMAVAYAWPVVAGVLIGLACGAVASALMRRSSAHARGYDYRLNLFGMGACMASVGLSELIAHESGLVGAAVCGMVIANSRIVGADEMRRFKEQISTMLVGALFLLLASRFDLRQLATLDAGAATFVIAMVLLVRPLSVVLATVGTVLTARERIFAAWLAPRGVVAASVASIAALELARLAGTWEQLAAEQPAELAAATFDRAATLRADAARLETMVYLMIFVTVALGGTLAGPLASLLRVRAGRPNGVIFVGGHRLARELALQLMRLGVPVRVVDTNAGHLAAAAAWNIPAALGDATDLRWLEEDVASPQMGWVMAATDNQTVDTVVSRWAAGHFGPERVLRWVSTAQSTGPGRAAFQRGRPLRHLLFQMDIGAARVETWTGPRDGALPFAVLHKGELSLVAAEPQPEIPDDATVVGVEFGPKAAEGAGNGQPAGEAG